MVGTAIVFVHVEVGTGYLQQKVPRTTTTPLQRRTRESATYKPAHNAVSPGKWPTATLPSVWPWDAGRPSAACRQALRVTPPKNDAKFYVRETSCEAHGASASMRRIDRDLRIAGPRGFSRPTAQHPLLSMHSSMSTARWRAGVARQYDTKGTPTDINAHTRATVRTSHRRPGRTTARACVRRRPPVHPSICSPACPPVRPRPSARVWLPT